MNRGHGWLKLSHRRHSGRLRPHEYTSYLPLTILLVFVGVALGISTASATNHPPPQAGSIGLSGTMPGPPPKVGATIDVPINGQHFSSSPVTVSGTCPNDTLVEIFKNNIFAGSTTCSKTGTYFLKVDLLIGKNALVARVFDALNQQGPDSNIVTVFYDALPPQASSLEPLDLSSAQLLLSTNAVYRGIFPEQPLNMPISVLGGTPPYAINIQWDDTTNTMVPRNNNTTFNVTHTYHKPGTFQINLQATDAVGRVAFLTVAAIVNGQPPIALSASSPSGPSMNKLLVLWPLYVCAISVVVSFWMGERREKRILARPGPVLTLHAH